MDGAGQSTSRSVNLLGSEYQSRTQPIIGMSTATSNGFAEQGRGLGELPACGNFSQPTDATGLSFYEGTQLDDCPFSLFCW
jgi:hypothetical protein